MNVYHDQWNVTLAVQAVRTLRHETHSPEDIAKLFWEPVKAELAKLCKRPPKKLQAIAGEPFEYPAKSKGLCTNLYLAGKGKKVIHLGTVFSAAAFKAEQKKLVGFYREFIPSQAKIIAAKKPGDIVRDNHFCIMSVQSPVLSQESLTWALEKYLRQFAGQLAGLPVAWLEDEPAHQMNEFIATEAKRTAKKQTAKEKADIGIKYFADIIEL